MLSESEAHWLQRAYVKDLNVSCGKDRAINSNKNEKSFVCFYWAMEISNQPNCHVRVIIVKQYFDFHCNCINTNFNWISVLSIKSSSASTCHLDLDDYMI